MPRLRKVVRYFLLKCDLFEAYAVAALLVLGLPQAHAQIINGDFEYEQLASIRELFNDVESLDTCENNLTLGYGCLPETADDGLTDRGLAIQLGTNATYANVPFFVYGNLAPATLADPVGSYQGRADQVFALQTVGASGVGPFLRMLPSGWTLKRVETPATSVGVNVLNAPSTEPVFLSAGLTSGMHTPALDNPTGALISSDNTNEDTFIQMNTESNTVAGRFLSPSDNGPGTLNSPSDWLASGNNVLLLRNRNNKQLDSSAGSDQGRGVVLSQLTSFMAGVGDEVTLTWLVGDRIGALALVDYDVIVRAGGTTIFSANSVADTSLRPFNDNGKPTTGSGTAGTFREITRTFTSSTAGALEISFGAGGSFSTGGGLVAFDNIRLSVDAGGLAGDFDEDGDVDGRDFLFWQRGNSPDPFSPEDLGDWQTNYGSGSLAAVATAIPEPNSVVCGVTIVLLMAIRRTK